MGYTIRVKASVTSHIGIVKTDNKDNFYLNGRFIYEHETDNIQVSTENNFDNYIFSVSDSMDITDKEKEVSISITREIKKYHEKLKNEECVLEDRVKQLSDIVNGTSNLLRSIYSDKEEFIQPSFACLLIKDDKATIISLGNCKVFIIRNGSIKQLTVDWEKTQKLLNLGIITNEQAIDLASRFGIPTESSINDILKSDEITVKEGDIFVLSTNGLTDSIEDEDINEMFKSNKDPGITVNYLVKSALKKGGDDNITVMAVSIEKTSNYMKNSSSYRKNRRKYSLKNVSLLKLLNRIKALGSKKIYLGVITCLIIFTTIFAGAKLINKNSDDTVNTDNLSNLTTQNGSTDNSNSNLNNTENTDNNNINSNTDTDSKSSVIHEDDKDIDAKVLPTKYTVKKGDTLYKISEYFYNDSNKFDVIMKKNDINDPSKIQIGQVLEIPEI